MITLLLQLLIVIKTSEIKRNHTNALGCYIFYQRVLSKLLNLTKLIDTQFHVRKCVKGCTLQNLNLAIVKSSNRSLT